MRNTDPTKVVHGEFLSETSYYKVDGKNINGREGISTRLTNQQGEKIQITDGLIGTTTFSASQFIETELVTATRLAELVTEVGDTVFTASFNKQPASADISSAIDYLNNGRIASRAEMNTAIREAYKGEERIIVARLLSIEALMGRAKVIDLDIEFKNNEADKNKGEDLIRTESSIRLIDLRNLNYLIYKGVKYLKKK